MASTNLLSINEPHVVHETIDGETILLDLNTGNYFSLEGPGPAIWEYIQQTGDWNKAIELLISGNKEAETTIRESVTSFINTLIDEKLLVPATIAPAAAETGEKETQLIQAGLNFLPPRVNKYSDMQDLLLLDPIHDVDEKGWPESKEIKDIE
jgi:hypothetical protein